MGHPSAMRMRVSGSKKEVGRNRMGDCGHRTGIILFGEFVEFCIRTILYSCIRTFFVAFLVCYVHFLLVFWAVGPSLAYIYLGCPQSPTNRNMGAVGAWPMGWLWLVSWLVLCRRVVAVNGSVFVWDWDMPHHDVTALLAHHVTDVTSQAVDDNTELTVVVEKSPADVPRSNESAAFLVLCRNDDVYDLLDTIQSIHDRYNRNFHHDWVFLNDKMFLDHFVVLVSLYIPAGRLSFGQVPHQRWLYPGHIDLQVAAAKRIELANKNVVYAESESYRHMCRFFLGFFQHHPLVAAYDYYWRVEPGVRFFCDIDYDVFRFMRVMQKQYAFVLSMFEYSDTIPTLWDTAREFFDTVELPENSLVNFVRNPDGSYNLCHFWLNFEIAATGFFRSPTYSQYFEHLDKSGGFFYERWGDAPVHTLAVAHMLNSSQVWWFEDMGYYHAPYLHCPTGPMYVEKRCACDQTMDFSMGELSCTPLMVHLLENGGKLGWH